MAPWPGLCLAQRRYGTPAARRRESALAIRPEKPKRMESRGQTRGLAGSLKAAAPRLKAEPHLSPKLFFKPGVLAYCAR